MAGWMDDKCMQVNSVTVPKNHTMCLKFDLDTASSCGRPTLGSVSSIFNCHICNLFKYV